MSPLDKFIKKIPEEFNEVVGNLIINKENFMGNVNKTDVTLFSLALADFSLVTTHLVNHDYYVAGGLLVVGVVLAYLYHKFGSQ